MKTLVCLSLIVLTSCLMVQPQCKPPAMWSKPGTTPAQFYSEKYICVSQAQFNKESDPVGLNWQSFNECMKAAGYTPVEE